MMRAAEVTAYPFWIVLGLAAGWAFHGIQIESKAQPQ